MRNLKNSIYFIEENEMTLKNEYYILLKRIDSEDSIIELFNSVYDFIGIRSKTTKEFVAFLKPADGDLVSIHDIKTPLFRKYVTYRNDVALEIMKEMVKKKRKVYPLLSDRESIILDSK